MKRMLALLLFVFIAYGATAEAVHKHGNLSRTLSPVSSTVAGASDESIAGKSAGQPGACLICQLHQNLFLSLFNAQPRFLEPPVQLERTMADSSVYFSQVFAPSCGRAPPLVSIL